MLGGWNFSKTTAVGGRGVDIFTQNGEETRNLGGKQELEGWFYNGGDGKLLKSLYIVGRGVCWPLIFWRPPPPASLYSQPPPIFQIFSNPTPFPTSLSPPTQIPTVLSVALFLWLNGWSLHISCNILLNDNMDLHMSSLATLVSEYSVKFTEVWDIFFTGTLIWYHTHKYKDTHTTLRDQ